MIRTLPIEKEQENVIALLGRAGRTASAGRLSAAALVSGVVALALSLSGIGEWIGYSICYVGWSYSTWALLFARRSHPGPFLVVVEWLLIASATLVAVAASIGVFFLALGPRWKL